jgi:TRAP transporter TAXI family solute receptor
MRLIVAAAIAALFTMPAYAAPIGIASAAQGSSTYNMALAISNVASANGLDLRPQPYKSTSQASGIVNAGELAFGLENAIAIRQAYVGEGKFKDQPLTELRLVARLLPLRMTLAVRKDSGIKTIADLKGKRLPAGFPAAVTGEMLIDTMLGTGGISYNDVQKVQVNDFTAMAEAFVAGDLDAFIHVIGTPRDEQVSRDVNGIVALQLGSDTAAQDWVKQNMPVGSLYLLNPVANITTITEPTEILQYDYYVYTNANEPADEVVKLIESLRGGKDAMVESVAGFSWFDPDQMYGDVGVPFHPAAEAYYRDHGLVH